jgi:hypothetical protein
MFFPCISLKKAKRDFLGAKKFFFIFFHFFMSRFAFSELI